MGTAAVLISKIDARIASILDDDTVVGDYRIADKTVSRGSYLKYLVEMRKDLILQGQEETPYESIDAIAYDIDEFGIDDSEYIGDTT